MKANLTTLCHIIPCKLASVLSHQYKAVQVPAVFPLCLLEEDVQNVLKLQDLGPLQDSQPHQQMSAEEKIVNVR